MTIPADDITLYYHKTLSLNEASAEQLFLIDDSQVSVCISFIRTQLVHGINQNVEK